MVNDILINPDDFTPDDFTPDVLERLRSTLYPGQD